MKKFKNLSFILAVIMVLQMILPVSFAYAEAKDVTSILESIGWINGGVIITDPKTDEEIEPVDGSYPDVPEDAKITLRYDFELPDEGEAADDYDFKEGDYFKIELPEGIDFNPVVNRQIIDAISNEIDGGDYVIANYTISGNIVTVTFTDYVEKNSDVTGWFNLEGTFSLDLSGEENPVVIDIEYVGNITINFHEEPEEPVVDVSIEKTGKYDSDTGEITWTIIVTPDKQTEGVSIVDVFGNNQLYVDNSFKVVTGSAVTGTAVTGTALTVSGKTLTYKFPEAISTVQVLEFRTKPTATAFNGETGSNESVKFENKADVKVDGITEDSTSAEININWIQKGGSLGEGGIINWEIKINNSGYSINNPVITDTIPIGLKLVDNSVKLKLPGGSPLPVTYDYRYTSPTAISVLEYEYSSTVTGQAILTYQTEIVDNSIYYSNSAKSFTNSADLSWEGNIYGKPKDSHSVGVVGSGGIVSKTTGGKTNYNDNSTNIIQWTVVINKNKVPISNAVFLDNIPKALKYVENSFVISPVTTQSAMSGFAYTPAEENDASKSGTLRFDFNGEIKDTYTVKFKTEIIDHTSLFSNETVGFSNSAVVSGSAIKNGSQTGTGKQEFNSQVIAKSAVGEYDYATRLIEWKIVVNRNKMDLKNAVLTDYIPAGMEYAGGFKVTSGSGIIAAEPSVSEGVLKYEFGNITDEYTVTFKTRVTDEGLVIKGNILFENKAELKADGLGPVQSKASINVNNPIVEKKAVYVKGTDYVKWIVPINSNGITLNNVVISDKLQSELKLDVSSVELYNMHINSGGSLTKGDKVSDNKYTVEYNQSTNNFTLSFKDKALQEFYTIDTPYQLEFVTDVLVDKVSVNNEIIFKGQGISGGQTNGAASVSVSQSESGGGGSNGSITLTKTDEMGNKLSGAKFQIFNIKNNKEIIIGTIETSENGKVIFNRQNGKSSVVANPETKGIIAFEKLLYKTYYVREIEAPDGYLLNDTVVQFRINAENQNPEFVFMNEKIYGDISFTKYDESHNPLAGAKFSLYDAEDEEFLHPLAVTESDEDGLVKFTNVLAGNYLIKETQAPTGYIISEDVIYVYVGADDSGTEVAVELTLNGETPLKGFENELVKVYGKIELHKSGLVETADGVVLYSNPLKGAEFTLYDKEGNIVGEPVTSDADGKVVFSDISIGEYVVRETEAPDGYLKSDEEIRVNVERSINLIETVTKYSYGEVENSDSAPIVENKSINIEFLKTDNGGNPLSEAEFKLFDSDGNEIQTAVSNALGEVIFIAVPDGEYTIKESKAPSGYKDYDKEIKVVVTADGEVILTVDEEVLADKTVINEKKPGGGTAVLGKIAIKKTDENKKVLSGAEFTLYDEDGKIVGKAVTGSDGTASFADLKPGNYVLKETNAPEGYVLDENKTDVTISGSQTKTYTFTNKKEEPKKPGRIEIIKTDEEGKLLSEAWFSLIDEKGSTLQNVGTVNGRAVFEDVPAGRYTVKEVQAPAGYELNSKIISVTVEDGKTVELKFVNKLAGTITVVPGYGNILINKVDENSMALSGAEFTLYNENNQIIGTAVSDESGRVMFENLTEGKYFVRETKAPEGYELVSDALNVNVEGGKTYSYKFKNVPSSVLIEDPDVPNGWETIEDPDVPGDTTLPDTGSLLNTWMLIVIGLVFILAGIVLYGRRIMG